MGARLPLVATSASLLLLIGSAMLADVLTPHDPLAQDLAHRFVPPSWVEGGRSEFLFGTDELGRDLLTRIIYGGRVSLSLGFLSVTISSVMGTAVGMVGGYLGGRLGIVLARLTDLQMAFPFLVLAIAVIALFGPSFQNLVLVLVLWSWPVFARLGRARVLTEKEKEYVTAADAVGVPPTRILVRHLLPNVVPGVVVLWTLTVAQMIMAEGALSFLGVGVPPPTPTWGGMLSAGRDYIATAWWLVTFPGLALMVTVLSVNILGDHLHDVLDRRSVT